ncbi:MAG: type VI secretion system protein ImpL [Desulfobacterales bacterium]|nr:type VI secretion system protein ImpL [Desulfobacterales bacterium]
MKQILFKILKGFIIFIVLALVAVLFFAITRKHLNWPWWVGVFILTGILGLWLGVIVLKKIFQRRSEDRFVRQIINQDTAYITDFGDKAKAMNAQEVQDRWKEAMDVLKKSHLKKEGNPMYVLPWYMIIGESGSGKTTAIESAGLSGTFSEITRTSGISGTRNCDWWFFEKAIIIDTAGRYAIPVDEGRDKEEWRKFLTNLVKYRKKEPLNGLIVTVGADKLVESGTDVLEKDGKDIRRRIQELMQGLGSKFPIYVLVTKCDLVKGMTQFCDLFPEKSIKQAMGFVNSDLLKDVGTLLKDAMLSIGERLRNQRLLLFQKAGAGRIDPSLLLFPEEFEKLEPGLNTFIRGAFQETPYQETPILRGVYFSSGRQEGSPYSHFLNSLGLIGEREILPGTNKGLFLFDIFSKILPGDRRLYAPTMEARRLSLFTRNIGLVSWIAVMIALCGLLSFSFAKNLRTLNYVGKYGKPPELTESDLTNVKLIDDFREAILEVEKQNKSWWIPRFGLNKSIKVEEGLKARYCKLVNVRFLEKVDQQVAGRVNHFDQKTPDRVIGNHAAFLVRRVNLMKAMREKGKVEALQKKPQPSFGSVMTSSQEITPELDKKIQYLHLYYLLWWDDKVRFDTQRNDLQALLTHIVTKKRTDLNWMAGWINDDSSLIYIYLADFWGGPRKASGDEKYIAPAFTVEGNKKKDAFIKELNSAISDPLDIAGKATDFGEWYKNSYITAWYDFGKYFPKGKERLSADEWRYQAVRMDSDNGPYFSLLDLMYQELEPFNNKDSAEWVAHVRDLKNIKLQSVALEKKGAAAGVKKTGKRLINRLGSKIGIRGSGKMLDGAVSEAAKNFKDYRDSLTVIGPISDDRKLAYEKTLEVFTESPSTSNSPFYKAKRAYKSLLENMGDIKSDQKMFRNLLYGPVEFLWEYACNETSCRLQTDWSKMVWWEIQNETDPERLCQILFGEQKGFVNHFVESKEGAGAFMARSGRSAYKPKWALGRKIPFKKVIFPFLEKGKQIKDRIRNIPEIPDEPEDEEPPLPVSEPAPKPLPASYNVNIKGMPTGTNAGAAYKPAMTVLELYCADKTTNMENRNYPVSEVFTWTPETCMEVVLKIDLEGLILTKHYRGEKAFQSFIRDFRGGRRVFTPRDFPRHETTMQDLNIRKIDVNYKFSGDVQGVLNYRPPAKITSVRPKKKKKKKVLCTPPPTPKVIVECWDS